MTLSIRKFGKALALILIFIFFTFIYYINNLYNEVERGRSFKRVSYIMIEKAYELKSSSLNLTKFARKYVITLNKQDIDDYYKLLAIRNGEVHKPQNYQNIYWSISEPIRSQRHPKSNKKISLHDEMKSLPYSKYQLQKLQESYDNSKELINLEEKAFNAIKQNNQKLAIKLLNSSQYEKAKDSIMIPLDEFFKSLFDSYNAQKVIVNNEINTLFRIIFILVVTGISIFFISLFLLRKKVLIPIEYLMNVIDSINKGKKNYKKIIFCNDEIGILTEQFFKMKEQRDIDFENLRLLSTIDPLTGIKNRRSFFEISERFFKLARRKDVALSIIMLDIDHFKKVNDTYGHIVGDEILKFLVKIVNNEIRDSDVFARYGGEEFIILLPDTELEGAVKTAQKIRKVFESTSYKGDVEVSITVSFGVAQMKNEKIFNNLIIRADKALYQAKEGGRNMVVQSD